MTLTFDQIRSEFAPYEIQIHKTGSNYICNPPVEDTDIDFIILCDPEDYKNIYGNLLRMGYRVSGNYFTDYSETARAQFTSYKKGNINYIVTPDDEYFDKFCIATELAKRLNLLEKHKRVELFHYVIHEELKDEEDGLGEIEGYREASQTPRRVSWA